MTLKNKILYLKLILDLPPENYADSFKEDILIYFDYDFSETNTQFKFLNVLKSENEIKNWVDLLTSKFVLKFNPEEETENDFIYFYIS